MTSVSASEFQKSFGEWHSKIDQGPVEITESGKPTAYLVSAELFHQLWQRYRIALPVGELPKSDIDAILSSRVETVRPFNLSDIPEIENIDGKPAAKLR
jgi:hypothetical protein